ncbi:MAG: hypothetical protein ABEH43_02605 [Flavobacteriales bacterium]
MNNVLTYLTCICLLACSGNRSTTETENKDNSSNDKTVKKKDKTEESPDNKIRSTYEPKFVKNRSKFKKNDDFDLKQRWIEDDVLYCIVGYSGGCETHEFTLYAVKGIMKSMPPKRSLAVYHNSNGDACRSYIKDTLKFNAKPLKYKGNENIILQFERSKRPLKYKNK